MKKFNFRFIGAVSALSLAFLTSAHAQYVWTGTVSSDPSNASNYSGSAPTVNTSNSGNLYIANGTAGNALDYTSADGTTVINGNIRVAVNGSNSGEPSSELDVTGGSLTINSGGTSTVGYHGAGGSANGTIGVSGGTLSIQGTDQFWFGNTDAATANVSGGEFIVGDQFLFSRQGATSTINLSGTGVFDVTGASGTDYNDQGGNGVATINLNGSGIFEQTGDVNFSLTGNFNINFGSGSAGQFSLLDASTSTLDSLITSGHIEINGTADTTLADYNVMGNTSGQGIIELATPSAVPEPSTWAMLVSGVVLLLGVRRFNRNRMV